MNIISLRAYTAQRAKPLLVAASIVLGLIGSVYFSQHLFGPTNIAVTHPAQVLAAPSVPATPVLERSEPLRLGIPAIDLNTSLLSTGLRNDGTLAVPEDYRQAGWYTGSPTPGERGPAIIVGHVDNRAGIGVFWRLRELQPGAVIAVDRADGSTARFKVDRVQQFDQSAFPTEQVYGNINHAGIRLITCGGTFNQQTRHYSDNIVVFGSLVR